MNKIRIGVIASSLLVCATAVHADVISGPGPVVIGGALLVGVLVVIAIIAGVSWFLIRMLEKKHTQKATMPRVGAAVLKPTKKQK